MKYLRSFFVGLFLTCLAGSSAFAVCQIQPWQVSGSDLYYNTGGIGVGTAGAPGAKLDVNGTLLVSGAATLANLSSAGVVTNSAAGLLSTLAGTTTTVLHGNASGAPSYSAVSLANDVTGTLPETKGGTNQTTYTTGDLLYASAANTLSKLAGVATGNALISGGVGTAPSWGKIGLTTAISGTLPVGNGGTGTATAFTTGSVVYAGASGVYSQDNADFFWDATNNRLGIGTTSPQEKLDVGQTGGNIALGRNYTGTNEILKTFVTGHAAGNVPSSLGFGIADGAWTGVRVNNVRDGSYNSQSLTFETHHGGVSNGIRMTIDKAGKVGIGMTPTVALEVNGTIRGTSVATVAHELDFRGNNTWGLVIKDVDNNPAGQAAIVFFSGTTQGGNISNNGATTTYATTSDRRLKENIQPTKSGLSDLMKIEIDDFNFKSDKDKKIVQGVMAQDLAKIYPAAVFVGGEDPEKNPWGVDYGRLTPLLIKAVQEQQAKIDDLKKQTTIQADARGASLSDERIKKNIKPFPLGLKQVLSLDPVTFEYNGLGGYAADGEIRTGLVAQQVKKKVPELVGTISTKLKSTDAADTELLKVKYDDLLFALINAVKEQQAWIKGLDEANDALRRDFEEQCTSRAK